MLEKTRERSNVLRGKRRRDSRAWSPWQGEGGERQKLEQLDDDRSAKSEETFARLANLEEGIEAVKERAKQLEVSRHFVVERVREVDLLVFEWEDKVKAIKETADHY